DVHRIVPGGPFDVTFGVGQEGLHHHPGRQAHVVHRVAAEVGDVMHHAGGAVVVGVLDLRHAGRQQHLFRTQREGHALLLGTGTDAVAHVDRPFQLRAGNDGVVAEVLDQLALEQVDVADELADQAAGRGLVDVHWAADLGDPALVHDGDALGHGHG